MTNRSSSNTLFEIEPQLVNPKATDNANRLMSYLCDSFGKRMLIGQQIGVLSAPELEVLHEATGKYPALGGFDMMNYSLSRVSRGAECQDTDKAIQWWNDGGIVTFCWHWNAPTDLIDQPPDRTWGSGFYTNASTFDLAKALADPLSEGYQLILNDIDAISSELQRLEEAGVPVLWRPLHEACGGWFWWGAKGPGPCIDLWKLMYERMTNHHKLNHLIWVWNGQHPDWYPGDPFVDIIGEDIYPPAHDYSSQVERFQSALSYTTTKKIVALTENGVLPDPDNMLKDDALWAWNCTWHGSFTSVVKADRDVYNEEFTELKQLLKLYHHPFTVTRDELPNLKTYPLKTHP
ncbi:MAG: glycoside hydrolase family 26 protein [Gorillibacterium sp.]|nr:glycoside hydrolase family 26 protein [Gorillibacterium sp.]